jgi:hypothetical protein
MTTKARTSVTDDLRAQQSSLKGHKDELLSEIDELSYLALIDKEPNAIARLAAINSELCNLTFQIETNEAALKEAHRRDVAAAEAERDAKRKQNAAAAADMLLNAEATAALLTQAMADLRTHAVALQSQFAEIRKLIDAGPTDQLLRINLARSLKAATMGSPMQLEHLAPDQRVPVDAVISTWATSIRNRINATTGTQPAKAA